RQGRRYLRTGARSGRHPLLAPHAQSVVFSSRPIQLNPMSSPFPYTTLFRSHFRIFLMSRKIILIKQELLLLVYELNRSGLLAENEKIRPILAQLEKLLLCDLSPSTNDSVKN